jgi:hypothetical protein
MLALAEQVLKATGSKSKIVFRPLPSDDPKQRQPDIALARSVLGWVPRVELKEGLAKTVRYFRSRVATPPAEIRPRLRRKALVIDGATAADVVNPV